MPASDLEDRLVFVINEVVANIVRHAYGSEFGDSGETKGTIDIEVSVDKARLTLSFTDHGPWFDPSGVCPVPPDEPQAGGMGISIVQQCADDLRYTRTDDHRNNLLLHFTLGESHAEDP